MKRILLITFLIITLFLSACREKTKEEAFNDIQKTFSKIDNYSSIAEIKVTGNKSPKTFKANHVFQKPDKYITEILEPKDNMGNKTIYNKNQAYLYNKSIDKYTILKEVRVTEEKTLFLGYFLRNLNSVEEIDISSEVIDKSEYIVIGLELPENNMYRAYEKLWIDKKTHLPYKLVIYDDKNKETISVKYTNVEYNVDLKTDIFKIN